MSVALGLRYKGGIVLATDSRVSGCYVEESVCKFEERTLNDAVLVFVGAGDQTDIETATCYIDDRVASLNITSLRIFREFAHAIINDILSKGRGDPVIELLLGIRYQQNTELLTATFDEKDQRIHVETVHKFVAIGSGGQVAAYLLKCLCSKLPNRVIERREQAERLCLYTMDEIVREQVAGCGGAVRLRTITAVPDAEVEHASDAKKRKMREQMESNLISAEGSRRLAIFDTGELQ